MFGRRVVHNTLKDYNFQAVVRKPRLLNRIQQTW
jgi:hypothetical protein